MTGTRGYDHIRADARSRQGRRERIVIAQPARGVSRCAGLCRSRIIGVMTKKVSLVITDDLDGSPGAEAVSFGLDGVSYEIDLAPPNKTRLADAVAPYIAAGRRVSRRARPAGRPIAARVDRAAVRAWAREAGLAVSDRGRISAEVMSQYEAAH